MDWYIIDKMPADNEAYDNIYTIQRDAVIGSEQEVLEN